MPPVPTPATSSHSLVPFVPQPGAPVRTLQASVERSGAVLRFEYRLEADVKRLRIPERQAPAATDGLWKHTCFEAFLMQAPGSASPDADEYRELNFSPSTQWAAYAFDRYREGMKAVAMAEPPDVRVEATSSGLLVDARVSTSALFGGAALRIALAAVIEDDSGGVTYWALKHAPARPDFHHPAGFVLEV